jgi:N-acetylmuramoyl-L-alanine amidase
MKKIYIKRISALILSFIIGCVFTESTAFALSKLGSTGQEVRNIQTRLKNWGYYSGSVDGIYGTLTVSAVKEFQRKNGLTADGVAGNATLAKIGLPTSSSSTSSNDVTLLAMVINGEARGESYEGQVAVGAVVLNRVKHSSFPNTIAGVIYQPGAFTAVDDGQINKAIQSSCMSAARDALNGWDPSGGAIYYYNPATATSSWIRTRTIIKTIGKHVFCK